MADATNAQWARMTVGDLKVMLSALTNEGLVNDETLVVVDSDPEGNGLNVLRQAYDVGSVEFGRGGQIEDFVSGEDKPAATLWLGVGY